MSLSDQTIKNSVFADPLAINFYWPIFDEFIAEGITSYEVLYPNGTLSVPIREFDTGEVHQTGPVELPKEVGELTEQHIYEVRDSVRQPLNQLSRRIQTNRILYPHLFATESLWSQTIPSMFSSPENRVHVNKMRIMTTDVFSRMYTFAVPETTVPMPIVPTTVTPTVATNTCVDLKVYMTRILPTITENLCNKIGLKYNPTCISLIPPITDATTVNIKQFVYTYVDRETTEIARPLKKRKLSENSSQFTTEIQERHFVLRIICMSEMQRFPWSIYFGLSVLKKDPITITLCASSCTELLANFTTKLKTEMPKIKKLSS